jgi:ectoine hydroxylase-related dioxygenase (phytanoyl-CoA dioxygenase family)
MQIGDWPTTADLNETWRDGLKHGLIENFAEFEAYGFTVIPPEKVAAPDVTDRMAQALLDVHARRAGQRITDLESEALDLTPEGAKTRQVAQGAQIPFISHSAMLYEDRVFEEAVMNPAVYAMARYACGKSVQLGDVNGLVKGQHADQIQRLHIDSSNTPPPFPPYPLNLNVTWTLTEYTKENGPVAIVPGSHRFGRGPMPHEEAFLRDDAPVKPIPIEAARGSLIVWSGWTWHATYPKLTPGIRLTMVFVFHRLFVRPIQLYRRLAPPTQEILDRNPPEFADLLGMRNPFPYEGTNPPLPDDLNVMRRAGHHMWA